MAEKRYSVALTAGLLDRLDASEAFSASAGAGSAFDDRLAELRATVIAELWRVARIGRRTLANSPRSAEALTQLAALPAGAPDLPRKYLRVDCLRLVAMAAVALLSIRHHRSLSFDFASFWPGAGTPASA